MALRIPDSSSVEQTATRIFTVTELNSYVRGLLRADENLTDVWVKGEVSNFKAHGSGHFYFTLKDEKSQIQCVMFSNDARNLKFTLENGLKILAHGSIDLYMPRGTHQLYVREIRPEGIGALHLAFEQLKRRLDKEGLFARKRPIPKFPGGIGIITSPTGAAIHDMLTILRKRYPCAEIYFAPAQVQGPSASLEIEHSINMLNRVPCIDILIVARGGGSIEDLWAFNEEGTARAIFSSKIPVISAIGHETDFTIADFVADLRAPTPSAAAELVVPDKNELFAKLTFYNSQLGNTVSATLENAKAQFHATLELFSIKLLQEPIVEHERRILELTNGLARSLSDKLDSEKQALRELAGKLGALSPLAILERGYSIALKLPKREIIKRVDAVNKRDNIEVIVHDGKIRCKVEGTKEELKWLKEKKI